ncbi:MAG: AAA family ATPase, partial [Pyrinomonadaceae bacterium]|nr:AAA family ATPase [Pyrinomonadaceae bacterium]
LDHVTNDKCPFCSQSLAGIDSLIESYRTYFSEGYNRLRREIVAMRDRVASDLGDRQIATVERTLDQNAAGAEFWTRYCDIAPPALPDTSQPGEALRALREAAVALLDRKVAAPLELVVTDEAFATAHAGLTELKQEIAAHNRAVTAANTLIATKKAATAATDLRAVDAALVRLRATKKRHEPQVRTACQEYETALAEKRAIEDEKNAVRTELDEYTARVIGRYEQTINQLLDDFNPGFRITRTSHGYPGGVASSSYQILINNTPVDLGDAETPLSQPSFKNTLSAGDRSTLALAFFLAHLEHDPDRAAKIVVFDDPFNSQDSFRKDCTVQKIRRCGETCSQVIVLSHDQSFLKRIWDRLDTRSGDRKCLEMARIGQRDTTICAWDIEAATQAAYKADHKALKDFYLTGNGNARDVVQKIRPVLETLCKNLGGGLLLDGDALGTIIRKIRDAGPSHQLYPVLDDLDDLNEYTRRYHHGDNRHAATEPISDNELQGYVKRTLDITGGC